ncbi:type 2 lanthipeptide synthetase LanM family protein [Leptolyngbya boryana CZ1]|uniref:Type 2 lanthipeptide synthetase LanM family protein n=1 Tax=Leptolyngbya boryana CZ1 TaxID=3060204 RepID=A0AA96WQZ4_LEPBY|nr:type 2 lanthipeptide synthetase LanM family protein [Leptolyngbya boryana]WNZ43923.1 type 2 lanthipeptide synthetase LanM family protein [Leptolyngbya boryana CZ1]
MNFTKTGITTAQLHRLVAQASTLYERLDSSIFLPALDSFDESRLQSRLDAWCQAVAKGDRDRFHEILTWDGLTLEQAMQAISPVEVRSGVPLPAWAELLRTVLDFAPSTLTLRDPSATRFLDAENPLPFEEVFTPFVSVAQQTLAEQTHHLTPRLSNLAHAALERSLLTHLIDTASHAIDLTFRNWRGHQQSSFSRLLNQLQAVPGNSLYLKFVQEMLQGKLQLFLQEYPVLARLLATQTLHWINFHTEFLQHLDADWTEIATTFTPDQTLGQVTTIKPALSDSHRDGRMVMALEIEPNLHLIYKPKPLGIEYAYNKLLTWLNDRGCPLPLKALQILYRETYAWVEFAEVRPCENTHQLERFYQRAGMILCLMYVLEATDCHFENLIASGEHLVVIDAETLLHPRFKSESIELAQTAQSMALYQMGNSVLRTALLPSWEMDDQNSTVFDYSGLGSYEDWNLVYRGLQWYQTNTDQMVLRLQDIPVPPPVGNAPTLNGQVAHLRDWVDAVMTGFEQMYRFLLSHREALLAKDSPLWNMESQSIRVVFRRTNIYFKLLKKLRNPEYLRDGADRSIELELLKRAMISAQDRPPFWSVIRSEQRQMEQLDIPCFTVAANQAVLELPDSRVEHFLGDPSFEVMLDRVRRLSDADLKFQSQLIYASLGARTIAGHGTAVDESLMQQSEQRSLSHDALLAEAIEIAQRLQERAISAPDGSVTWLAPQFMPQDERFHLQPTDNGLYDGKLGIALFLAALAQVTSENQYRHLCMHTLQELHQSLNQPEPNLSSDIGTAIGLGGTIYSLTQISLFLDDQTLLEQAVKVAHSLTPETIERDRRFDIISGTAGALLSLLKLYRVTEDTTVLKSAIACGQHLLNESTPMAQGRAWKTLDGQPLAGFSHGAAGIAYALLHLAEVSGQVEFRTAAIEAIAYEQSLFIPAVGNWPDLRDFSALIRGDRRKVEIPLMSSWCHGATGIGLARVGGLQQFATDEIHQEIETAIQTTTHFLTLSGVEQLCCGKMGQIELLLTASDRLAQPSLLADAQRYASQVIHSAKRQGGYKLEAALPISVYVPSFFRGEAGIGYTLLRLIAPAQVPSALLFD